MQRLNDKFVIKPELEQIENQNCKYPPEAIDRCKKGDSMAQSEIYRLYYRAMYNSSLRIVSTAESAQDFMQDAFLTAFIKLRTYMGEVIVRIQVKK
jgi:hypothetical protein